MPTDYKVQHVTTSMEESIAHPETEVVCIALPNNLHEEAVMLCCKHKKAVITTKPLGRNASRSQTHVGCGGKSGHLQRLFGRFGLYAQVYKSDGKREERSVGKNPYGRSQEKRTLVRTANGFGTLNRQAVVAF